MDKVTKEDAKGKVNDLLRRQSTGIPVLRAEPSLRPAHAPTYAATLAQRGVRKHGEERRVVEVKKLKKKPEKAISAG